LTIWSEFVQYQSCAAQRKINSAGKNSMMRALPGPVAMATTPAYGKTRGGEANVERILDAALTVFAVDGFAGARIDAIAEMADLSKPNLLYYFRTKAELYLAVLGRTLDMWLEPLKLMQAGDDPRVAVAAYITRKLEHARDYPEASRLFAMEVMRGAPILNQILAVDLKILVDEKVKLLTRWMDDGHLPGRAPHHVLFMIWAMTQHYADFAAQVQPLTGKTLADKAFFDEARQSLILALCPG
jgi:TetR/AcrR family transcriptional regulator